MSDWPLSAAAATLSQRCALLLQNFLMDSGAFDPATKVKRCCFCDAQLLLLCTCERVSV